MRTLRADGAAQMTARIDRLNALLNWWGVSTRNPTGPQGDLLRFHSQALALQQIYRDLQQFYIEGVTETQERLAIGLKNLIHCAGTHDIRRSEIELLDALRDFAVLQAAIWTEIEQQLEARGSTLRELG